MSVVTCMKVCVLADSGSGLPMLKVKMDYPTTPYERLDGAMLGTPAGRLWHFESRCMSQGVVGLGAARLFRCSRTTWAIAQR